MAYVSVRPDGNPRPVSYPYYTKLASAGDRTFFRHCDMNIEDFLEDERGGNIIQDECLEPLLIERLKF